MGRIRYGVSNLYYATATDDGNGNLTYATPVQVKGCKSITLDPQNVDVEENADNVTWYKASLNNGYTGTVEFEDTSAYDTFMALVLGQTTDASGVTIETADDQPKEFALLWQFELAGDSTETGKKGLLYRCSASRPSVAGQTKETGSLTVATNSVPIVAMPRVSSDHRVKASCTTSSTEYAGWFSAVYVS